MKDRVGESMPELTGRDRQFILGENAVNEEEGRTLQQPTDTWEPLEGGTGCIPVCLLLCGGYPVRSETI